jgi:DNA adenine methylase
MVDIRRPALRYYGGKWRLAPWIISHFPSHTCYVEPFCGAASVFFRKPPTEFEILNDLDGDVVNFFRVLRGQSEDLIRAIIATPFSRQEYQDAWRPTEDPLERARRYYVCAWQGWGGGKGSRPSGWRYQHTNNRGKHVVDDWDQVDHLWAIVERLKVAFIECDDALAVIERYDQPHTLFYLDPPYLSDTRTTRWADGAYACEIDENYHYALLSALQRIEGMAVISGYPSELYEECLEDWSRYEHPSRTTNTSNVATEVIWVSPRAQAHGQRTLF